MSATVRDRRYRSVANPTGKTGARAHPKHDATKNCAQIDKKALTPIP
jgi:hypothetical protein